MENDRLESLENKVDLIIDILATQSKDNKKEFKKVNGKINALMMMHGLNLDEFDEETE